MYKYKFQKRFLVLFAPTLFFGASVGHAKNLDINATGSVTMAYDDNITYVHSDRLSDFVTNLETGLTLLQQGETHKLSLKTDVTEQIFADHSNFDNTAEDLNFDYKQDLSEHDHLDLSDVLTHAYEPISFDDAFGRTNGRYGTLDNQTGVSYTHDFTQELSGEVHYADTLNYYWGNGPVNTFLYQAGTKVIYTHDSANIFNVNYDYIRRLFQNGPGATTNSLLTEARHYFTPQFYADLGMGPDFISSFTGKNNIEPHYTAALTDQVDVNNRVRLTFEKQDTTDAYTEALFNSWRTALILYRQFSLRLSGNMNIFYGQGRYNSLNVSDQFTGAQAQINYALTKNTKLAVGYAYTDSASKNSGYAYRKNYFFASITFLF